MTLVRKIHAIAIMFFRGNYILSYPSFVLIVSTLRTLDVIYPKGDRDAVSISSRVADLLLPEKFVNDTIFDFYIK
jgi:sentrin-specific protease 7